MSRKRVLQSLILFSLIGAIRLSMSAGVQQQQASAGSLFKAYPVQGNIWLIPEQNVNVVVSLGRDGVMLVDSGTAENVSKLLATVKQLAGDVLSRQVPFTPC